MVFAMPADREWDEIANVTGDASWRASEMKKHYASMEHSHYVAPGTPGHGFSGPIHVSVCSAWCACCSRMHRSRRRM